MQRQQCEEIPPSPHTTAPHKSHLQAGGTLQHSTFSSQACREGNSGGYSCSGYCPVLYPGRAASPRKGKKQSCAQTCQCSRTSTITAVV